MKNTLADWLEELENRHTQEIQLGLERVKKAINILKLGQWSIPIITVAGTNGKGSTVALLAAIYQQAGYKVGSYTSPHLLKFNERIKINEKCIADTDLVAAFNAIEKACSSIPLTYFEMATLAALWYFKKHPLEVLILEVGLGGRLDAVNSLDHDLAIITTIAFDHEAYLGDTLEAIGYEKAGIMRPNKPIIYADLTPPSSIVLNSQELRAPLLLLGKQFSIAEESGHLSYVYRDKQWRLPLVKLHPHAVAAAITGIMCLQESRPVPWEAISQALVNLHFAGRFQYFSYPVNTILDVAHNPQAAQYLAQNLDKYYANTTIHAIFSVLADKDIDGIIQPFLNKVRYWYPTCLNSKRSLSSQQLTNIFHKYEVPLDVCYNTPILAYEAACKRAKPKDLILVFGSFITVSAVLTVFC